MHVSVFKVQRLLSRGPHALLVELELVELEQHTGGHTPNVQPNLNDFKARALMIWHHELKTQRTTTYLFKLRGGIEQRIAHGRHGTREIVGVERPGIWPWRGLVRLARAGRPRRPARRTTGRHAKGLELLLDVVRQVGEAPPLVMCITERREPARDPENARKSHPQCGRPVPPVAASDERQQKS